MKKLLLSIMLMLVGTTSWAQSGWNDPSGKYQAETVVYAVVDCGNNEELYLSNEAPLLQLSSMEKFEPSPPNMWLEKTTYVCTLCV